MLVYWARVTDIGLQHVCRAHLYQEPVFSISSLIEQTGVWAWVKFLLCLPLVFSVMFGRSIWKRSR